MNIEIITWIGLPILWFFIFLIWINFIYHSWRWYNKMYVEWKVIWIKGCDLNE
jgi:hypothetical protein